MRSCVRRRPPKRAATDVPVEHESGHGDGGYVQVLTIPFAAPSTPRRPWTSPDYGAAAMVVVSVPVYVPARLIAGMLKLTLSSCV
ncbi:MAG: hypothetical protein QOF33_1358 [Thermomicrobiales bacterium]|nr:hypothetical protein [Thermomicrobiales bacterium]